MNEQESELFKLVDGATTAIFGKPAYQRLVNMIADRIASEFGHRDHDFDLAESALIQADDGSESLADFIARYENILRQKYAAQKGQS